jgi:hypothetical protein
LFISILWGRPFFKTKYKQRPWKVNIQASDRVKTITLGNVSIPVVDYLLDLPKVTIDSAVLSSLQLKLIICVFQRNEEDFLLKMELVGAGFG